MTANARSSTDRMEALEALNHAEVLEAEVERLREALIRTAAHLAAAIDLLERGGKAAKRAAPSDKMFDQMLTDYRNALDDARAALAGEERHGDRSGTTWGEE
jgi:hypothetical protein